MESVFVLAHFLQLEDQLFENAKSEPASGKHSEAISTTHAAFENRKYIKDREHNLLFTIQRSLFQFFESAFQAFYSGGDGVLGLNQNRLSDVVLLWCKFIQPWNFENGFIRAAACVDQTIFQGREPTYETFPKAGGWHSLRKIVSERSFYGDDGSVLREEPNRELAELLSTPCLLDQGLYDYNE